MAPNPSTTSLSESAGVSGVVDDMPDSPAKSKSMYTLTAQIGHADFGLRRSEAFVAGSADATEHGTAGLRVPEGLALGDGHGQIISISFRDNSASTPGGDAGCSPLLVTLRERFGRKAHSIG